MTTGQKQGSPFLALSMQGSRSKFLSGGGGGEGGGEGGLNWTDFFGGGMLGNFYYLLSLK